ncbi:MAG: hypothetical protein R3B40_06070 [Polyangiales bacterium]|nr:hypothetical protein [Myxococcales bacterium]MCB9657499.1 hypothetical protein [Sandaracinaceae bacterium]
MTRRCHPLLSLALSAVCLGGCGGPADTPSGAESTTGAEPIATPTAVGEVAPVHGATLFAVYVAVAEAGAPALEQAAGPLRERSIMVSVGELGCDRGAAEALGVAPDWHGVAVMFETREAALAFADSLDTPPAGVAQVTAGCAD